MGQSDSLEHLPDVHTDIRVELSGWDKYLRVWNIWTLRNLNFPAFFIISSYFLTSSIPNNIGHTKGLPPFQIY